MASLFASANATGVSILGTIARSTEGASRAIDTALNGVEMLHIKTNDYLADIKLRSEATNKVRPLRIARDITLENLQLKRDLERQISTLGITEAEWAEEMAAVTALLA